MSDIDPTAKARGLLLAAVQANQVDEITWVDITVGDLVITVASDAMKAAVGDRTGVRLPVTYAEQVPILAGMGCVSPTQAIADAMYAQAAAKLVAAPLPPTTQMDSVKWTLDFADKVDKEVSDKGANPGDLVFGAWKLWILHPRIVEKGAVNYGFWDVHGHPIQTVGGQHNDQHTDYSQVLQPVKRMARPAAGGDPVDLLDHFASNDHIPAQYLDPYRT